MPRLKDALGTALLALGLAVPILALRTEQNISNELVLQPRWGYVASPWRWPSPRACSTCWPPRAQAARAPRAAAAPPAPRRGTGFAVAGLVVLLLYPVLALAITGSAGAIKWIDNFGIQIMIYVMLGWGLNIVVGLAGPG